MLGLSEAAANLMLDALAARAADGTISLHEGTRGAAGAPLLAELRLGDPAFERASGGKMRGKPTKRSEPAGRRGKPTWGVLRDADGGALAYGTVGTDLLLDRETVELGGSVFATDFGFAFPVEG